MKPDRQITQQPIIAVAPMMDLTTRHCRYFMRVIAKHVHLYTEMVTSGAIIYGDQPRHLAFDRQEHPVALQLGGSDPVHLAECAKIAETYGYAEINLNIGCPSDRVQAGRIGACLMAEPDLVARCVESMRAAVSIPITIKTRIGIDEQDSYQFLTDFVSKVEQAGSETFIIHARKAWLHGLNPKQNREVPPLCYERVYQLKQDFPQLTILLNGGLKTVDEIKTHLPFVDGVMIGREAYSNPYLLAEIESEIFANPAALRERKAIIEEYLSYCSRQLKSGVYLKHMIKHILGIFQGQPGARKWRRYLSERSYQVGAGIEVIQAALAELG